MTCSSGTYVRTLCSDIGGAIGCGGHLASLRRIASSGFGIDHAWTMGQLKTLDRHIRSEKALIPMADALQRMPTCIAGEDLLQDVAHGRRLTTDRLPPSSVQIPAESAMAGHVKVIDAERNVRAILKLSPDGRVYDYCCVFN